MIEDTFLYQVRFRLAGTLGCQGRVQHFRVYYTPKASPLNEFEFLGFVAWQRGHLFGSQRQTLKPTPQTPNPNPEP